MQSLVNSLAQAPHSIPIPSDWPPFIPSYNVQETLTTCFTAENFENQLSFPDIPPIEQLFDNLEKNLTNIYKLQVERLPPGPKSYIHSGSIPLFLTYLSDPTIHQYSLCPFPDLDTLDISTFFIHIFDTKVPPDRAAWAIHYYSKKKNLSKDIITKELLSHNPNDFDFFIKFSYHLYIKNLIHHMYFLDWAIEKVPTENLLIFKNEIIKTHSIFKKALKSSNNIKFIDILSELLLLKRSHIIQLNVLCQKNNQNYENLLKPLQNSICNRRTKKILDLISAPHLSFMTTLRNILVENFPNYDNDKLKPIFEKLIQFISIEQRPKLIINLCNIIFWFNNNSYPISTITAYIISLMNVKFPIEDFVSFLFENSKQINLFINLFIELQYFGCFNYISFHNVLQSRGYFTCKPNETKILILNLPSFERSQNNLRLLVSSLKRLNESTYDDIIQNIIDDNNSISPEKAILLKFETFKLLPKIFQFEICSWAISKTNNISEISNIIFNLGFDSLFNNIMDKLSTFNQYNLIFSRTTYYYITQTIPSLIIHQKLNILLKYLSQHVQNPISYEIILFIQEKYKDNSIWNNLKSNFGDILKNNKNIMINNSEIRLLFRKFSYLCSLHTLDAFHGVRSSKDFEGIIRTFFSDLLLYPSLNTEILYDFYLKFSESLCISKPSEFFIKTFLSVILSLNEENLNSNLELLLFNFFLKIFENKLFEPSLFLHKALTDSKKQKSKSNQHTTSSIYLIKLFMKLIQNRKDLFSITSCMNEAVIKGFLQLGNGDITLISEFLSILKDWPTPILSEDIIKLFDTPGIAPISFGAAMFSLLPKELRNSDFDQVFSYFCNNVTSTTSTFWTLWIKYHPYYTYDFPVTIASPDKQVQHQHQNHLASAFYDLLCSLDPNDSKTELFSNCWVLACMTDKSKYNSPVVANAALNLAVSDLKNDRAQITPSLLLFLHPAMSNSSNNVFQTLCECLTKLNIQDDQFSSYILLSSSVFIVYASRLTSESFVSIINIAEKLLEWLLIVTEKHFHCFDFLLDTYNFIVCCLSETSLIIQETFHEKMKNLILKLPLEIQDLLLFNLPPQTLINIKDPLFYNVIVEVYQNNEIHQSPHENDPTPNFPAPFPDHPFQDTLPDDDFPWFN